MRETLKEYCLKHGREDLLAQWNDSKNGDLTPADVSFGSHKKIWWQCSKGHEWRALIKSRVEGSSCPYGSGRTVLPGENDLQTIAPLIAKQWHPTKNGKLLPSEVCPAARDGSGGSANMATNGRRRFIPARERRNAAARSAQENHENL